MSSFVRGKCYLRKTFSLKLTCTELDHRPIVLPPGHAADTYHCLSVMQTQDIILFR